MGGGYAVFIWKTGHHVGLCYVIRAYSRDVAHRDSKYWSGCCLDCCSNGGISCSICTFIGKLMLIICFEFGNGINPIILSFYYFIYRITFINRCHYYYSGSFHWLPVCWHYFYPKHMEINYPIRWENQSHGWLKLSYYVNFDWIGGEAQWFFMSLKLHEKSLSVSVNLTNQAVITTYFSRHQKTNQFNDDFSGWRSWTYWFGHDKRHRVEHHGEIILVPTHWYI